MQHVRAPAVGRVAPVRPTPRRLMLRILALGLALIAVAAMSVALVGMVTGRPGDRAGWALRVLALACFGAAVALNAAAH